MQEGIKLMLGLGRRIKLNSTLCQVSALEGPHIYIILANLPQKNFVKNQKLYSVEIWKAKIFIILLGQRQLTKHCNVLLQFNQGWPCLFVRPIMDNNGGPYLWCTGCQPPAGPFQLFACGQGAECMWNYKLSHLAKLLHLLHPIQISDSTLLHKECQSHFWMKYIRTALGSVWYFFLQETQIPPVL